MKKISIMGCGWLGMPLAKSLTEKGYQVKGSTTSGDKTDQIASMGAKPFVLTLSDQGEKMSVFLDSDCLVLTVPPGKNDPAEFKIHMQSLAETVKNSAIKHIIYISTSSVYPNVNGKVTEEDAEYIKTPRSGVEMLVIEDVWKGITNKVVTVIRFAGLYGPGRNPGRFLAGRKTSGANSPVNLIHQEDCIAIIEFMINSQQSSAIFNACAPGHPSRKKFYTAAAKKAGKALPVFEEPSNPDYKIVSSEKLITHSGYRFKHPDPMASI